MEIGLGKYSTKAKDELEEWIPLESTRLSKERITETYNNFVKMHKAKTYYKMRKNHKTEKLNDDSLYAILKFDNDGTVIEEYGITEMFYRQMRYYLATGKILGKK